MPGLKDFIKFNDKKLENKYSKKTIPWGILSEAYYDGKIDITGDIHELVNKKEEFTNYKYTADQIKFFLLQFLPELITHSKSIDKELVQYHYDIGNDFFNAYLGETMVYTSGIFHDMNESLEQAQFNKLETLCRKMQLKKGEKHLDIGCGWGTLIRHAAKHYGTHGTGVTISTEQTRWGNDAAEKEGVQDSVRTLTIDYRDIPNEKYNKISCVEMAEHVGIRYFQKFLRQVNGLLEDDGIFYLQIAGLRRNYDREDINWGLFMAKYIFRGADASLPLSFVVNHLEKAGFEIRSVETIGIHYSRTIKKWHENWVQNEKAVCDKYGQKLYRIWNMFLAWSVLIAANGGSTCFQIICHKNRKDYNRERFLGRSELAEAFPSINGKKVEVGVTVQS